MNFCPLERAKTIPEDMWVNVGRVDEFQHRAVQPVMIGRMHVALTYQDGQFGAINGMCNHVGGPLGESPFEGEYVVCPWHYWKFHCRSGEGEPVY